MNELQFEGIVTEVAIQERENRYHEKVKQCYFGLVEDAGLHDVRQCHVFDLYGDACEEYGAFIKQGARLRVTFFFSGYNRSTTGHWFNNERVTGVQAL